MANTLTNITETMVQDEVLEALKLGLTPLNAFSFMPSDTPSNVGDIVRVPLAAAKTAGSYSSTFESGDSTTTSAAVTMAAPVFSSWYVNPNLEAKSDAERFLSQGREAAYAVAKNVVQAVLAKFVAANIGDVADTDKKVVESANYDVDDQADLWSLIKTKGVRGNISAIHTIDYAAALLKDAALQDRSASGSDVLMTGELPSILGARQFYTDAFPTAVTSENTGVIYTGKTAAAIAMTVPNVVDADIQAGAGVNIQTITDPDTGISLQWRTWMNTATGAYWGSVVAMYGVAFVQDAAVRIVSA